jgi:hypothetical protein
LAENLFELLEEAEAEFSGRSFAVVVAPELKLKDRVWFMAEELGGELVEGIIYRFDKTVVQVFCPVTQKMYPVVRDLISK